VVVPPGPTYADAVELFGGAGPLITVAGHLLAGPLSVATAGGVERRPAPFGEYLDARLVVPVFRVTTARARVRSWRLGPVREPAPAPDGEVGS
jgi:hypothetical protein